MLKRKEGLTAMDACIAIIAIMLFTSVILSLMYNVRLENIKIKAKAHANIYLIQIAENIGIANYDEVIPDNLGLIPADIPEVYTAKIETSKINEEQSTKEDIIKKIKITISYTIGNKTYEESLQRLKVRE